MPVLQIAIDRDHGEDSRSRQLLAVHRLRGDLESLARADEPVSTTPMAVGRAGIVRQLLELVDALDRRLPQVQRVGEAAIADDAAALKARALKRIEELESTPASAIVP
jgi:hypothetical protein